MKRDLSRRDVVKMAGVATAAAGPFIQTVKAANDQVQYGFIGTGSRGSYLLGHLAKIDSGRCTAVCDINQTALDKGAQVIGTNPQKFKDYRELLSMDLPGFLKRQDDWPEDAGWISFGTLTHGFAAAETLRPPPTVAPRKAAG